MQQPEVKRSSSAVVGRKIKQYVIRVIDESTRSNPCKLLMSKNDIFVTGKPVGVSSTNCYMLSSYGSWHIRFQSFSPDFGLEKIPANNNPQIDEYVVVEFETLVVPSSVTVFETLQPAAICRIWALTVRNQWQLLWDKRSDAIDSLRFSSRCNKHHIFRPKIRTIHEQTRVLRFEFGLRDLSYTAGLDAILLAGTLGQPVITQEKPQLVVAQQSNPEPTSSNNGRCITQLPKEMISEIFSYLDVNSLWNAAQACELLDMVAYDRRLYREVNLRPFWMHNIKEFLAWLTIRCTGIRKLDLSWCDLRTSKEEVQRLLELHGSTLTHLRLNSPGVDRLVDVVLSKCPNLIELFMRTTSIAEGINLSSNLYHLTKLDLSETYIGTNRLVNLLKQNPSLKHLNLSNAKNYSNPELMATIGSHNRELLSLNLFKTLIYGNGEFTVRPLANCTKLQELNLGHCPSMSLHDIAQVLENCKELRFLSLAGCTHMRRMIIRRIAQHCRAITYLDLMWCKFFDGALIHHIFRACPTLRFIDLNFCTNISPEWITRWRNEYPLVEIKCNEF